MNTKVYILVDQNGTILRCDGGVTYSNIDDVSEWILIDEGDGKKYSLCQKYYFDGGLYTEEGVCRYKWTGSEAVLRSTEEIERDIAEKEQANNVLFRIAELKKLLANSDYISCKIAEGAATREEYAEIITQRQAWRDEINQLET